MGYWFLIKLFYLDNSSIFFLENQLYKTGKTNSVSSVAVTNPPTITLANGRWISAPTPLDINIGIKPKADVIAVIKTGLNLEVAPSNTA